MFAKNGTRIRPDLYKRPMKTGQKSSKSSPTISIKSDILVEFKAKSCAKKQHGGYNAQSLIED
jgi:hypothetical protein